MSDIDNARDAQHAHRAALIGALMGQPVEPVENINVHVPPASFDGGAGSRPNVSPVEPTLSDGEMWAKVLRGEA